MQKGPRTVDDESAGTSCELRFCGLPFGVAVTSLANAAAIVEDVFSEDPVEIARKPESR